MDAAPGDGPLSDTAPRDLGAVADAGDVGDQGWEPDTGFRPDAQIVDAFVADTGNPFDCTTAADCTLQPFGSVRACSNSAWSCIAGECVWECTGGRTCALVPPPDAATPVCLACDGAPPQCYGEPCRHDITSPNLEDAYCARSFFQPPPVCFGDFVQLSDGMICSLEMLPTGAPRSVLACGPCQTQFMW